MLCSSSDDAPSVRRSGVLQMAVAIHLSIAFQQSIWNNTWTCYYYHNFLNETIFLDLLVVAGSHPAKDETSLLLLLYPLMWAILQPAASSAGSCFGQLIVKRYFVNIEAVPWAIWRHRCNRILLWSKILRSIAASEKLWADWTWT